MRELILTTRFRRDLRRATRRGKNEQRLREVLDRLMAGEPLQPRQLNDNVAPLWKCHIENDSRLFAPEDEATATLMPTGTHNDILG